MTPAADPPVKRKPSLASRFFRSVAIMLSVNVLVTFVALELIADQFDATLLNGELAREVQVIKGQITKAQVETWRTALVTALYVPDGDVTAELPPMFAGRTSPFAGEVEVGTRTYLVVLERLADPPGNLHVALDISFFGKFERQLHQVTMVVGAAMVLFGVLLAQIGAKHVVQPLAQLTREIAGLRPGSALGTVYTSYRDRELAEIARTIDNLLRELDAHAKRERGLISLASHELRTPVTVIAGALDVLAGRDTLCADDARVVARIRRATDEMGADIEALLALARRPSQHRSVEAFAPVDLADIARSVLHELEGGMPADACRVQLLVTEPAPEVVADPALVRMLLRNLIQNAVHHTRGSVEVKVGPGGVTISDHGPGLPPLVLAQLAANNDAPDGGLGLFIVQLICERLGWRLDIRRSDTGGTVLALLVGDSRDTAQAASSWSSPRCSCQTQFSSDIGQRF